MKIKEILTNPNYYVSDTGKVFHKVKGEFKQLKTAFNSGGYEYCCLGDKKYHFIAELVWTTFNEMDIPNGYELNHIDSDSANNNLKNLQICTHKENCQLKEPSLIPSFQLTSKGKYQLRFSMMGEMIYGTYPDIDSMLKDFELLRQTKIKMQKKMIKKINKRNKELSKYEAKQAS